ncbi:MAG: autotransporter domain-containing protein [Proteobacteria bacterium]|nr:autotransporter domain-containing protein [Pseudomonadota bacterium]
MIRPLYRVLGRTTLSLGLACAPLSGAFAGQTITIINQSVGHDVYGNGKQSDGDAPIPDTPSSLTMPADSTTVTMDNSTVSGNVYGGADWKDIDAVAMAMGTSVTIQNNSVVNGFDGKVFGGYAWSRDNDATATDNTVDISGNSTATGAAGGWAWSDGAGAAEATGNTVNISDSMVGSISSPVYGGYAWSASGTATATGNTVDISDSTATNIFGGHTFVESGAGDATATGNSLAISNTKADGAVYSGYAQSFSGTATAGGNTLTISDKSTVDGNVYGGDAYSNSTGTITATGNIVDISDSTLTGIIVSGGHARGDGAATASNNSMAISGGMVGNGSFGADIYGGWAHSTSGTAEAMDNTVTFGGDTTGEVYIYGGRAVSGTGNGRATGNTMTFESGVVARIYGGAASSTSGGTSGNATSTGNSVFISGGTAGLIYGGYAWSNGSGTASSTGNIVTISGGEVNDGVYAGRAISTTGIAEASNNTLTISGNPILTNATLYGGYATSTSGSGSSTNNTLNLHTSGLVVAGLQDFQNLNFYVPATLAADGVMLHVTGTANISGATVNLAIDGARSPLQAGDHIKLIDASYNAGLAGVPSTSTVQATHGATLQYDMLISTEMEDHQLWAFLPKDPTVNPKTKSLSEGFLSGMALLNQGGDLVAGWGMSAATSAARRADHDPGIGYGTFGTLSGGWSRYDIGSHAEMTSVSLMAGLSRFTALPSGDLVLGVFFEYGNGSYDTYAMLHGDGDLDYIGGGIIGRMDFTKAGNGHFYAEGSARIGNVDNDYTNNELRDFWGREAKYDASSAYYGIHLGAGYLWDLAPKATLDLYGKYFWTRQEGDAVRLSTGESVAFDDVNSQRLRVGARFSYALNKTISPYLGAAYEHEFDGDTDATTNGYAIGVPSLSGGTGMAEIGLTCKPSKELPVFIDLGVQGYAGIRDGFTGTLHLRYDF